jgi:hypothetical protein
MNFHLPPLFRFQNIYPSWPNAMLIKPCPPSHSFLSTFDSVFSRPPHLLPLPLPATFLLRLESLTLITTPIRQKTLFIIYRSVSQHPLFNPNPTYNVPAIGFLLTTVSECCNPVAAGLPIGLGPVILRCGEFIAALARRC